MVQRQWALQRALASVTAATRARRRSCCARRFEVEVAEDAFIVIIVSVRVRLRAACDPSDEAKKQRVRGWNDTCS